MGLRGRPCFHLDKFGFLMKLQPNSNPLISGHPCSFILWLSVSINLDWLHAKDCAFASCHLSVIISFGLVELELPNTLTLGPYRMLLKLFKQDCILVQFPQTWGAILLLPSFIPKWWSLPGFPEPRWLRRDAPGPTASRNVPGRLAPRWVLQELLTDLSKAHHAPGFTFIPGECVFT